MEAIGKKKRLESAKKNGEKVKLIFQYPSRDRAIIKSGYVKEVYEDSFSLDEIYDGDVEYGYTFLEEIKGVRQ